MLSRFSRIQFFATLWTTAHKAPLSMGFSRQEQWSGLPCCPPGDLPGSVTEPTSFVLCLPRWQAGSLPLAPPGKPCFSLITLLFSGIIYVRLERGNPWTLVRAVYVIVWGVCVCVCVCFSGEDYNSSYCQHSLNVICYPHRRFACLSSCV